MSLTISVDCLGICRTRIPCVDIGRSDENGILEGSSGNGDLFGIFQRHPRSVAFATSRGNDTFIFLAGFGRNCNSGTLKMFEESRRGHSRNHAGAYDQTRKGLQDAVGLLRTSAVLLVQRRKRASVFGLLRLRWGWPVRQATRVQGRRKGGRGARAVPGITTRETIYIEINGNLRPGRGWKRAIGQKRTAGLNRAYPSAAA